MHDSMNSDPDWSLDPQLARDTVVVGDLPLCQIRLINDANYPWLLLIPRRSNVSEVIDLREPDRAQLMREIAHAADALKDGMRCDKINIAALGNVVAQLHVHVIARYRSDPAWPKPVWGASPALAYDDATRTKLIAALREKLAIAG
jgi:diadenosine tetraphosphate (Ap4A) HIT family hydrolase